MVAAPIKHGKSNIDINVCHYRGKCQAPDCFKCLISYTFFPSLNLFDVVRGNIPNVAI